MKLAPNWSRLAQCAISTVLLGTVGCTGSSYMGISLTLGQTTSEVQLLARRAQAGDKQAQLDLGIRFEEGNGVPQNEKKATKLYLLAASDSGGTIWVYSPDNGAKGRMIPIDGGPKQAGLDEAKRRLRELCREELPK